jgi:hypothetical protein
MNGKMEIIIFEEKDHSRKQGTEPELLHDVPVLLFPSKLNNDIFLIGVPTMYY